MKIQFIIYSLIVFYNCSAQTIGGSAAYSFLNLSPNTLVTAAGGVNISNRTDEAGIFISNPALLYTGMDRQINTSFNNFIGGIKAYSLSGVMDYKKWNTVLGGNIYFIDYGNLPETDAAGNIYGNFHPVDYVIQFAAARQYLEKFSYGVTFKFIHSGYQLYQSSAIAFDAGILYNDSSSGFNASITAKNMGFPIKSYAGQAEDLPFDLEIGITKRLENAPFGFSITAQHAHQFNILYNDTAFNNDNNLGQNSGFFTKIMNHLVVATHIYLGDHLEAIFGYNQLRRTELNIGTSGNGLNGFSAGFRIRFQKLQIEYSRSSYQRNVSYNQFGLSLWLKSVL